MGDGEAQRFLNGRYKIEATFRKFRMMLISSINLRDGRQWVPEFEVEYVRF